MEFSLGERGDDLIPVMAGAGAPSTPYTVDITQVMDGRHKAGHP